MSVRAIASVGVLLCASMMSFAIYLGVVEHVYGPLTVRTATLVSKSGRQSICVATEHSRNTSTTNATKTTVEPCKAAQALAAK